MTGLDIWALVAYAAACVCLGLRANMLKPWHGRWANSPELVWVGLHVLSVACAIAVYSLVRGPDHATAREAMAATALAVTSAVMLINLHRQRLTNERGPTPDAD